MTEKESLIARLTELGTQLNRDVSTSGTIPELKMRIAELQEELGVGAEPAGGIGGVLNSAGTGTTGTSGVEVTGNNSENTPGKLATTTTPRKLVSVKTLATLHIEALHATRNEPVSIVEPGVIIRVSDEDADLLIFQGLVREV